jgi:putative spermidine/putrescine transport system permease protein
VNTLRPKAGPVAPRAPGSRAPGSRLALSRRLARVRLHSVLLWAVSALAIVFLVAPSIFVILVSFGEGRFVRFPPSGFTTEWFGEIAPVFWSALRFSLEIALVSTLIGLVLGVPAAHALARGRFRARGVLDAFLRAPLQVPYIVMGVAFLQYYRLVAEAGGPALRGASAGLIAAHVIVTVPFILSAAAVGFEKFDRNLEDAAYGLGMGRVRTFFRVTLPSIRPSLVAGAFFAFLISFDNVPVSLYLGVADESTLPVLMFQTAETAPSPALYAVSSIVVASSVLAVVLFNRYVGLRSAVGIR